MMASDESSTSASLEEGSVESGLGQTWPEDALNEQIYVEVVHPWQVLGACFSEAFLEPLTNETAPR